jgi:hypothetical protein
LFYCLSLVPNGRKELKQEVGEETEPLIGDGGTLDSDKKIFNRGGL